MQDDDLDDLAFLFGSPSAADVLRQHSRLIEAELCIVQTELSRSRRDVTQLADMYQASADELARLKVAHEALGREKNGLYVDYVAMSNRVNHSPHLTDYVPATRR